MSDIQPNGSWQPASPRDSEDPEPADEELFDGLIDRPNEREGLPPGFRMRHDSHYVDQLTRPAAPAIRMVAIADIDAVLPARSTELHSLVASIARFGLLQPLLVRRRQGRYDLIAGAKRLAAAAAAGLREVPCVLHEVDESEARALGEASNMRTAREDVAVALQLSRAAARPVALSDLGAHLEAIASCINLLPAAGRPLRERVALQLMRVEVQRAAWLSAGLAVLADDPVVARGEAHLPRLFEHLVAAMQPECALDGFAVTAALDPSLPTIHADQQLLAVAFGGVMTAMHAMTAAVHGAPVRCTADVGAERTVVVEIAQDAVTFPASHLARFFDLDWRERPGGYAAAVALLAARRIAQLHGGRMEALTGADSGCRMRFEFPVPERRHS